MEPFLGQICMFGFNFAPRYWAFCDGQLLPIGQNSALFSLLGTIYGGDGRTSFGLPDLRSRVAIHQGSGPGLSTYRIGQKGGAEAHTLLTSQLPAHQHTSSIPVTSGPPNIGDPVGNYLSASDIFSTSAGTNEHYGGAGAVTGYTGGGQSFDIRQPYLTISYCIALQGVFPSRS